MIASVASVALRTSVSNQRSRIGRAAPVSNSIASGMSSPSAASVGTPFRFLAVSRNLLPRPILRRSCGKGSGSGAAFVSGGSRMAATRSSKRVVARIGLRVLVAELGDLPVIQLLHRAPW